ncbi:MAG: aromatic ring-hydroxylating dioxygenase subunit alpha [Pseudomonadota bacterium]
MTQTHTPLEQASALDPQFYTRQDVYDFELSQIIRPSWQVIAPASSVSGTGDVISRDIGGVPIVVVRSSTGQLNGFYNICPHRAGPLATCDARGLKRLRCSYHGWAYDFDGNLKIAPEMQDAEDFDRANIRLTPIDVREWNGLVMARIGEGVPFDTLYGGIEDIAGPGALDNLTHHTARLFDVKANWKVYVDNFLEGYHLPFVHPGLTQLVDYTDYKTELGPWWSLQRSPVEESGPYAAGEGLYFFVYPNVMLNIMPGRLQTNRVVPTGLDTCQVEFDFYYAPGAEGRAPEDLTFSDQVQEEDRLICEHVQKGLSSTAYKPRRLSPSREGGVWHYQNLLRSAYAAAGLAETAA